MSDRIFLCVLDSVGSGELPDAAEFGDEGSHTLKSAYLSGALNIPNLKRLGIGNIEGLDFLGAVASPLAARGRMAELSKGKDTTTGHWELAGITSKKPMPTFPDGFPADFLEEFSKAVGYGVLCNKPYSGTAVIADYGEEHLKTGALIVYTSADSVFQIAAHESLVSRKELYRICGIARKMLCDELAVGRVIARPFSGEAPNFYRTDGRRDFSLEPPKHTLLDALSGSGFDVISVGKISDIFCGRGITRAIEAHNNEESAEGTSWAQSLDFSGLCFANFVDFDMNYGHRNDARGYAEALSRFDLWLGDFISKMKDKDILIITADHGCDPGTPSTDHSREYVPLLVLGKEITPTSLGTVCGFSSVAATVSDILGVNFKELGESFFEKLGGLK